MSVNKLADKLISQKFWGEEPIYKGIISNKVDARLIKILNWYNNMSDEKGKDKWLIDYMKKYGYNKTDISNIYLKRLLSQAVLWLIKLSSPLISLKSDKVSFILL